MATGKWSGSGLAKVFEQALQVSDGDAVFSDFEPYPPIGNVPASFFATPVRDENDNIKSVIALQLPVNRLNKLLGSSNGLGKTGQTYIVGQDLLMRSSSRFSKNSTVLRTKVDTTYAKAALKGLSSSGASTSYRENPVIAAYQSYAEHGIAWAVLAEQDQTEIFETIASLRERLILWSIWATLAMCLFCILASWLAALATNRQLNSAA